MSKNRLPQPSKNGTPQPEAQQHPAEAKTKTTKRAATETEELAVKLIAAFEQITAKEQQIANLQIEVANLKLASAAREKQIIEEKYGLRGQIQLTIGADGKRTISITTPVEAEDAGQPTEDAGATPPATPPADAPKSN